MKGSARLLLAVTASYWFAMYTYPVLLTDYVQNSLGASAAFAGTIVGSYGFVQMVLRIPVGYATDAARRRVPFIRLGLLLGALAALLLFWAKSPAMALVGRGAAGAAAGMWACFTVLYATYLGEGARTRAMGRISTVMSSAQLVATVLGSLLAGALGIQAAFLLAAAAGAAGLLMSARLRDLPVSAQPVRLSGLGVVLRSKMLWLCSGLAILMQIVTWSTLYGFSPTWAIEALGANSAELGLLSVFHLIPCIALSYVGGTWLAPRLGVRRCCMLGFGLLAASCLGIGLTTAFWQMLALQMLCGAGIGIIGPMMLSGCLRDIPQELRGLAMGSYQSIYGIGMFIGPMIAGGLVEAFSRMEGGAAPALPGYRAVFLFAAAASALGGIGSLLLPKGEIE